MEQKTSATSLPSPPRSARFPGPTHPVTMPIMSFSMPKPMPEAAVALLIVEPAALLIAELNPNENFCNGGAAVADRCVPLLLPPVLL